MSDFSLPQDFANSGSDAYRFSPKVAIFFCSTTNHLHLISRENYQLMASKKYFHLHFF